MKLARPLVVFDLETTGTNINVDRIVDISLITRLPDGGLVKWASLVNPCMPIPAGAAAVHGITDELVKDAPTFEQIADQVMARFEGCDIGGFNVARFDLPLLQAELGRAGGRTLNLGGVHVVDAMTIFHAREKRDLSSAVRLYLGRQHEGAHRAEADAFAALQILEEQQVRYQLPDDVAGMVGAAQPADAIDLDGKFTWSGVEAVLAFGKHKGKALRLVARADPGFLRWMLGASFSEDTKKVARLALAGQFPTKGAARAA